MPRQRDTCPEREKGRWGLLCLGGVGVCMRNVLSRQPCTFLAPTLNTLQKRDKNHCECCMNASFGGTATPDCGKNPQTASSPAVRTVTMASTLQCSLTQEEFLSAIADALQCICSQSPPEAAAAGSPPPVGECGEALLQRPANT